jgi:glycosyltransferase involved in cell wall biosynthesis
VVVLMSTYQGERYVGEQLRSILDQLPPGGCIRVRDDGSRDGTVHAIEALGDERILCQCGPNLGFARSFLTLLAQAPADADLVMFSDQDDVWLPGRIERAWRHLAALGPVPGLYGSGQMLVDASLRPLHRTPVWPQGPSLRGALTENMVTGCTAALNRQAVQLLQRAGVVQGVHFHDWWLYLVVSAFGRVVVDAEPTVLYRQHRHNHIGYRAGWLGRNVGNLRFLWRHDFVGILLAQVGALQRHYGAQLDPAGRQLLAQHFCSSHGRVVARWRLILSGRRWRQHKASEIGLRLQLALHRLRLWPLPGRHFSAQPRTP